MGLYDLKLSDMGQLGLRKGRKFGPSVFKMNAPGACTGKLCPKTSKSGPKQRGSRLEPCEKGRMMHKNLQYLKEPLSDSLNPKTTKSYTKCIASKKPFSMVFNRDSSLGVIRRSESYLL